MAKVQLKEFQVSYYLDDYFHTFVKEASCEAEAILKVIAALPKGSYGILRGFRIEPKAQEWN